MWGTSIEFTTIGEAILPASESVVTKYQETGGGNSIPGSIMTHGRKSPGEFRIGDTKVEFDIVARRHNPGGAILLWHVDDIEAAFGRLLELGATGYDPNTKRGESGFVTASVVDPFGNILGIMYNPHYVQLNG